MYQALAVPLHARLPHICLKCGRTNEVTLREHTLAWIPRWAIIVCVVAVSSAMLLQPFTPHIRWLPLLLLALPALLRKATLSFGLCSRCRTRWRLAKLGTALLLTLPLAAAFGALVIATEESVGGPPLLRYLLSAGILALGLIMPLLIYVLWVERAFVVATRIDEHRVLLAGVHADAASALVLDAQGATHPQ